MMYSYYQQAGKAYIWANKWLQFSIAKLKEKVVVWSTDACKFWSGYTETEITFLAKTWAYFLISFFNSPDLKRLPKSDIRELLTIFAAEVRQFNI